MDLSSFWTVNKGQLWAAGKTRELHKLDIYNHNDQCAVQVLMGITELSKQQNERSTGINPHCSQEYPVNDGC